MPTLTIKQHWTDSEVTEFCVDILTVAAEGGINYWASFNTERNPAGWVTALENVTDLEDEEPLYDRVDVTTIWRTIHEIVDGQHNHEVAKRYLDWIREDISAKECINIDAECADIIVQLAIFEKLVYG